MVGTSPGRILLSSASSSLCDLEQPSIFLSLPLFSHLRVGPRKLSAKVRQCQELWSLKAAGQPMHFSALGPRQVIHCCL